MLLINLWGHSRHKIKTCMLAVTTTAFVSTKCCMCMQSIAQNWCVHSHSRTESVREHSVEHNSIDCCTNWPMYFQLQPLTYSTTSCQLSCWCQVPLCACAILVWRYPCKTPMPCSAINRLRRSSFSKVIALLLLWNWRINNWLKLSTMLDGIARKVSSTHLHGRKVVFFMFEI